MFRDPVTGQMVNGVKKPHYTHEALADAILANPGISQRELAGIWDYSEGWISQIIASDSFQAYLHTRKEQVIDPMLRGAIEESFKGLVLQSMRKLREKLEANPSDQLCLEIFKNSTRALGYGARPSLEVNVTNNTNVLGVLTKLPPAERVVESLPVPPAPELSAA